MHLDLNMGRYAGYVWPAYTVSAVLIGALVASSLLRARRWRAEVRRRERSERP